VARAARTLLWLAVWLVLPLGCRGGCTCSSQSLAVVANAQGDVSRDYAAKLHQWEAAPVGAELSVGDAVRTGDKSSAQVLLDDGAGLALKESTTVRLLETEPGSGERGLQVEEGELTVEASTAELLLRTDVGLARIEAGSVVRMGRGGRGLRFFAKVGKAQLEADSGKRELLTAGQGIEIGVGLAVLERFTEEDAGAAAAAAASASAEPEAKPEPIRGDLVVVAAGPGTSAQAPGQGKYSPLPAGPTTVSPGTRLRLRRRASAKVQRGGQEAALHGPGEYLVTGESENFVALVSGTTLLTADGRDVALEVPDGVVVAHGSQTKSVAEVTIGARKLVTVNARLGSITVRIGGKSETLRGGEGVSMSGPGTLQLQGRDIGFADMAVNAGGSLAVHDPDPPTAVGFSFAKACPGDGIVELLRGRYAGSSAVGRGRASLRVPKGRHAYRIRCIGPDGILMATAAQGTVTIMHDAGTAPLAAGAPSTLVDTDGRSYTVMYQNRLPTVTVRWPHPPQAGSYVLVHTSPTGTRSYSSGAPSYGFKSGAFAEGRHQLVFQAGDKQSRPTTVLVRFDPAAPKAAITSPANGSFGPGATVNVAGIALPGWRVFAGGTELKLDAQGRFNASATAGDRVLLIRFQHPHRGGDVYLRRAAGVAR
jgi:hypothetical protein